MKQRSFTQNKGESESDVCNMKKLISWLVCIHGVFWKVLTTNLCFFAHAPPSKIVSIGAEDALRQTFCVINQKLMP